MAPNAYYLCRFHSGGRPFAAIRLYQQIQLLEVQFNQLLRAMLVFVLIQMMNLEMTGGLYLLTKDRSAFGERTLPMQIFFILIINDGFVGISKVFSACAEVHHSSKKVLSVMKKLNSFRFGRKTGNESDQGKLKEYQKMVRSLRLVKVQFGSTNHIEKLTPIMFQQFVTDRLIDSLLMSN